MNSIYDELIKIAKTQEVRFPNDRLYLRAMMAQVVIREMFADTLARTELRHSSSPEYRLESPKEKVYADGYILDEVANLLVTHRSGDLQYCRDTRVVFVTNDEDLTRKLLKFAFQSNLIVIDAKKLVDDMATVMI
ncbi:MAG: hypothetical protein WAQ99_11865 [Pyrinomonadaceae bacterium]